MAEATLVKTLNETRVRHDFSVTVTRIELEVEKKILQDQAGERYVIAPSTLEYGPPRFSVTWEALATLAMLVCQFAIPFHRLGTMLSTTQKRFSAATLSRMLHYVAERALPIYLELAHQLANAEILASDDTNCRILEVNRYAAKLKKGTAEKDPPWSTYRTSTTAQTSIEEAAKKREVRKRRRAEGDRTAVPSPEEKPSLGMLIARELGFEFERKKGDGPKEAMHVSVVSGRSVADDPTSLIVFYRSHLGSSGNLLEKILAWRDKTNRKLFQQGDMSTTNSVTDPELRKSFEITSIGCLAHTRRPFAINVEQDVENCEYMLHLMLGIFIHEQQLDVFGRNRENVLAIRQNHSKEQWDEILALAREIVDKWPKSTTLGTAANYIINHFNELTAYLSDPRLEPTNNLQERMLRMEKLIEKSSMFRKSLEGRFVLDVVRTILQSAIAAGVSPTQYLVWILRSSEDEIRAHPEKFTPHAWAAMTKKSADRPAELISPEAAT